MPQFHPPPINPRTGRVVLPWDVGGENDPEVQARDERILADVQRAADEDRAAAEAARAQGQTHYVPPAGMGPLDYVLSAGTGERVIPPPGPTQQAAAAPRVPPNEDPVVVAARDAHAKSRVAQAAAPAQAGPSDDEIMAQRMIDGGRSASPAADMPERRAPIRRLMTERVDSAAGPTLPRSVPLYTNIGTQGDVVVDNGETAGAPSRGTLNMGGDEALLQMLRNQSLGEMSSPEDYYNQRAREAVARQMIQDPLYLERQKAQIEAGAYYGKQAAAEEAKFAGIDSALQEQLNNDYAEIDADKTLPPERAAAMKQHLANQMALDRMRYRALRFRAQTPTEAMAAESGAEPPVA
jgi:hypothetical protein